MKTNKRWMKSAIETAKSETPALPFHRGHRKSISERRAAMVASLRKAA